MNEWFAHGQTVQLDLPPEDCCSACMRRCSLQNECGQCLKQLRQFEPSRINLELSKSPVQSLSQMLTNLHINDRTPLETPPYDTENLAEELISNLLEFKCLLAFREFVGVFSLGKEIFKAVIGFVELNFDELITPNVMMKDIKTPADDSSDSDGSSASNSSRNVASLFSCSYFLNSLKS